MNSCLEHPRSVALSRDRLGKVQRQVPAEVEDDVGKIIDKLNLDCIRFHNTTSYMFCYLFHTFMTIYLFVDFLLLYISCMLDKQTEDKVSKTKDFLTFNLPLITIPRSPTTFFGVGGMEIYFK
jgi:hypothetical protein